MNGALLANFYTQGEVCSNGTRVFVQDALHDRFIDRLTERPEVESHCQVWLPLVDTISGVPLVRAPQLAKLDFHPQFLGQMLQPSPVIALNRAVAVSMSRGPAEALLYQGLKSDERKARVAAVQAAGFQGHELNPAECNAATWHGQDEFGTGQPGLPYTRSAAHAVWQQLRRFRDQWQGPGGAPLWSDAEMTAYVETWTAIADATQRQSTANATFAELNTEHGACGE